MRSPERGIEARQPLLTKRQAARLLSLGESTFDRLLRSGALPSVKVAGRRMIIPADLDDYIARHREQRMVPRKYGRQRDDGPAGTEPSVESTAGTGRDRDAG